jgi:hypothetical protein
VYSAQSVAKVSVYSAAEASVCSVAGFARRSSNNSGRGTHRWHPSIWASGGTRESHRRGGPEHYGSARATAPGLFWATAPKSFGFDSLREYEVILGDTIDRKRVSLLNCFDTRTTFGTGKLGRRDVFAHVVLDGVHVTDADPLLHAANATFRNAAAWWGKSGVNARLRSKTDLRRATIRYSARKPIVLFADGDVTLSAYATLAELPSSADDSGDYNLKEEVRIEFVSKSGRALSYVTRTLNACQDLLSIACQAYCDMMSLNIFPDARYNRSASYHAEPMFRGEGKSRRHKLLFGRMHIARDPRRVFTAWLCEGDKIAAMRALYLSAL